MLIRAYHYFVSLKTQKCNGRKSYYVYFVSKKIINSPKGTQNPMKKYYLLGNTFFGDFGNLHKKLQKKVQILSPSIA